ncbi:MAG: helix-turn-helix transcriptional regulator [Eubacterium sp.]|nr:helix-turn-helix transcriptional regulator [Eubacterium sp.]
MPDLRSLSFGGRVLFIRNFKGLSQYDVGHALGFSERTASLRISQWETGFRNPSKETVAAMAKVLDVSEDMLKIYDNLNPNDFFCELLWLEELLPGLELSLLEDSTDNQLFLDFMKIWKRLKNQLKVGRITKKDYINWKLNYRLPESEEK